MKKSGKGKTRFDAGKAIADKIIEMLEKGVSPWHCPWTQCGGGVDYFPRSAEGRVYRGMNIFVLAMTAMVHGYKSPYWLTFKKCSDIGGKVKKGENGTLVIYWNRRPYQMKDEDGKPMFDDEGNPKMKVGMTIQYYSVFNAEQCEGLPDKFYPKPPKPDNSKGGKAKRIKAAERIWDGYEQKPKLVHAGGLAFYNKTDDFISIPPLEDFKDGGEYYSTLFHEACHSTGHESRLNRNLKNMFGSEEYGKEELVAEMGAQILCQSVGITRTLPNAAAYCKSWVKAIKSCPDYGKAILCAAAQAQKAADYIMGVKYDKEG